MIVNTDGQDAAERSISAPHREEIHRPETTYHRLSRLAAKLLRVPIALISMPKDDTNGSLFRGIFHDSGAWDDPVEKLFAHGLCLRVTNSAHILAIPDLRDAKFVEAGPDPLLTDTVAFLGLPLRTREGDTIGAVCVMDRVPRVWTDEEIRDLRDLGELIVLERSSAAAHNAKARGASGDGRAVDGMRDDFISILGHELRNPIAAIMSAVHLARQSRLDEEEVAWSFDVIERQGTHLVRLIDDLLDVSRIAQGRVQIRRQYVELAEVVERAISAVNLLLERKNHQVVVSLGESPIALDADPTRIEQILVHLLNNAAKFTDSGGRIAVESKRAGHEVLLSVSDNGIGMPSELLPHVFDMLSHPSIVANRAHGGLGLGLTLVRRLVEMHGGKAEAASDGPGKGSVVSVTLPLWKDQPVMRAEHENGGQVRGSSLRILVVDDNRDSAKSLAMLLKISGHQVHMEHDGEAAIDAALDQRPDVVILDIGLPGRDGYEVAQTLRHDDRTREAYIVAISGYNQEEDRRKAREAGFNAHFVKPVDVDELLSLLANFPNERSPSDPA
jgi:signal transduction histidine kinase/CheY-like chemotaxis protein